MLVEELQIKQAEFGKHFKPGFLPREHTVFQFTFSDEDAFYLIVNTDDFEFHAGLHQQPTITIMVSDHKSCWALLAGKIDGMDAFMDGRYRADGNIVLSQLILYLFKSNDSTNSYEVQD